jgi:hypothetical protein
MVRSGLNSGNSGGLDRQRFLPLSQPSSLGRPDLNRNQVAAQPVHNSRILHQNSAIDIAGLSWCMIPVQKYSVVCDRLIRAKLTPGPSGNGPGHRGGQRGPLGIAPKDRSILHDRRSGRCPRRCKVFWPQSYQNASRETSWYDPNRRERAPACGIARDPAGRQTHLLTGAMPPK